MKHDSWETQWQNWTVFAEDRLSIFQTGLTTLKRGRLIWLTLIYRKWGQMIRLLIMAMKSSSSESSVVKTQFDNIFFIWSELEGSGTSCILFILVCPISNIHFLQCERGGGRVTPCVKGYVADCDMILEAFWQHKFTFLTFLKNCNDLLRSQNHKTLIQNSNVFFLIHLIHLLGIKYT